MLLDGTINGAQHLEWLTGEYVDFFGLLLKMGVGGWRDDINIYLSPTLSVLKK